MVARVPAPLDTELLLDALQHTRLAYLSYGFYPSEDFRQEQLRRVDHCTAQVRALHHANNPEE